MYWQGNKFGGLVQNRPSCNCQIYCTQNNKLYVCATESLVVDVWVMLTEELQKMTETIVRLFLISFLPICAFCCGMQSLHVPRSVVTAHQ